MTDIQPQTCTAFAHGRAIASGDAATVAVAIREITARDGQGTVQVFDDATGQPVDFDLRGTDAEIVARLTRPVEPRGPGRPKLGVTAREVTLLPKHWEWLAAQPGGASVTLRKLVEAARRADDGPGAVRRAQEAANRFMTAMAGDQPGYEEATRALFAGDAARFEEIVAAWPGDLRAYAVKLAGAGFPQASQ